jgi:hypothetical protein
MRIVKDTLIIVWGVLAVILVPPAIIVTLAFNQAAEHYVETGLLPFKDGPAERRATEWLRSQGKRTITVQFEIDPEWSQCPWRTRCYWYTATDGMRPLRGGHCVHQGLRSHRCTELTASRTRLVARPYLGELRRLTEEKREPIRAQQGLLVGIHLTRQIGSTGATHS